MDELRCRVPETVPDDVELFERGDEVWGRDEHGEFRLDPMTGSEEPQDGRCGAVVKFTMERYGETRYCTGMPESTFVTDGSDFCKHHKSHEALMERAHELFKHGYFATNYTNFVEKLDTAKFLFAVEMVGGLFEMSRHDFDVEHELRDIDASDSELIEEDEITIALPIPTKEMLSLQANELWTAALKQVMTQNMQEVVFEDGVSQKTIAQTADMEGQITDVKYERDEHHLHLPISRLAKDIKEHLTNGGVELQEDESGVVTFQKNDYTLSVEPDEETASGGAQDADEAATDFAEALQAEGDAEDIEIT
jgi:hypothetical protein